MAMSSCLPCFTPRANSLIDFDFCAKTTSVKYNGKTEKKTSYPPILGSRTISPRTFYLCFHRAMTLFRHLHHRRRPKIADLLPRTLVVSIPECAFRSKCRCFFDSKRFCISILALRQWLSCWTHTNRTDSPRNETPNFPYSFVPIRQTFQFQQRLYVSPAIYDCCAAMPLLCLRQEYRSQFVSASIRNIWQCTPGFSGSLVDSDAVCDSTIGTRICRAHSLDRSTRSNEGTESVWMFRRTGSALTRSQTSEIIHTHKLTKQC